MTEVYGIHYIYVITSVEAVNKIMTQPINEYHLKTNQAYEYYR